MTTSQWLAKSAIMFGAAMAFSGGLFLAVLGAKIDMMNGIQAQGFALADIAVAALLVIAANSFNNTHKD